MRSATASRWSSHDEPSESFGATCAIAANGLPSTTFGGVSRTLARKTFATRLIIVQALCIPRREFRDLRFRVAAADLEEACVVQWQEVRYRALDDPQSMHGKIEVANDFWVQ